MYQYIATFSSPYTNRVDTVGDEVGIEDALNTINCQQIHVERHGPIVSVTFSHALNPAQLTQRLSTLFETGLGPETLAQVQS